MKYTYKLLVIIVLAFLFLFLYDRYRVVPEIFFNQINLYSWEGKQVFLKSNGKFQLVVFWQTWCGDCHEGMPKVSAALFSKPNIEGIAITNEPFEKQLSHQAKLGNWDFLRVDSERDRTILALQDLGVYSFPTYFLLNPSGEKIWSCIGNVDTDEVNRLIQTKEVSVP